MDSSVIKNFFENYFFWGNNEPRNKGNARGREVLTEIYNLN